MNLRMVWCEDDDWNVGGVGELGGEVDGVD